MIVDRLLNELGVIKPEWGMVVDVKYFLGLTDEEAAETLGLKLCPRQRMGATPVNGCLK